MKYFLNKETEKNNLIILIPNLILIGSCKKDDCEDIESKFSKNIPFNEILPKEQATMLPLASIQKLSSRSTDDDIEFDYLSDGKEKDITLEFESPEQKQLYLTELKKQLPKHLTEQEHQQGKLASITPPLVSLALAALAIILFIEKLPKATYVIGGIWLIASLFAFYKRFTKPPVITRWAMDKSKFSKGATFLKQAYAWVFILVAIVGVAQVLPKDSGPAVIYDHALKESLHEGNITTLLEKEGDINFKDKQGKTALHHLVDQASYRSYEIGESLLTAVLLKAASGKNILNKEKLQNKPEHTAIALIKAGADVNVKDSSGKSIMQYAIENYADDALSIALFETMLEKGAKLDFVMDEDSMTPIQYAKEYTKEKLLDKKHLGDLFAKYE